MAVLWAAMLWLSLSMPLRAQALEETLSYLEDPSAQMTIEDVAAREDFAPVEQYIARGFSRSAHWIKIDPVQSEVPLLLSVGLPNLDDVRLYTQDAAGLWAEHRTGDRLAYAARPMRSPFLGFELAADDMARPVYLRVVTAGTNAVVVQLYPLAEGKLAEQRQMLAHMAMFGLQLMAITVCFVLFIPARDLLLVWFGLSQLVWLVAAFTFSGYASLLFPYRTTDLAYTVLGTASFLIDMAFHLVVLRRFAPPRRLFRLAAVVVGIIWIAVPLLALKDVTLALQTRSYASVIVLVLVALMAMTIRDGSLMPLWLIRSMYGLYLSLVLSWLLPVAGLTEASWLASHAVALHGTVNFVLMLTVVVYIAMREMWRLRASRMRLLASETDRAVRVRTIKAQSNLLNIMTHEVATALSVIRYALAQEAVSSRNSQRIGKAISGLDQTMRSLNVADRIIAGALDLRIAPTDLMGILQRLIEGQSDARISLQVGPGAEGKVATDPGLIEIAMNHLLDNACKYAPPDGGVEVSITQSVGRDGSPCIEVRISNALRQGPPPDLDRLCETFYRDPQVLDLPGTGMGLSIVKDLTERLGAGFDLRLEGRVFVATLEVGPCLS